MPSYFCLNGATFKISDKEFDNIYRRMKDNEEVSTTEPSSEAESNEPVRNKNSEWRKQENGYYNSKPNDENYFKKYYQSKQKVKFICERCGKELSDKSNKAKHQKSKKCQQAYLNRENSIN